MQARDTLGEYALGDRPSPNAAGGPPLLAVAGVNFRTAPLFIRERLSFSPESVPQALGEIAGHPFVHEALILSTCNRTELYAVVEGSDQWPSLLRDLLLKNGAATQQELENAVYCHSGEVAARHLFRVAAGLDSMVLGEVEIVHQIKQAARLAGEQGTTGTVLRRLADKALEASKLARTEVRYDECGLSVASLAVAACKQTFPELSNLTVMVLGAGETAQLTMHYLISKGVRNVLIANRTIENAQRLAEVTGGQALAFLDFAQRLGEADVLISCTSSPHYILTPSEVRPALAQRNGRPMLIVDLAVPRDVDPAVGELPGLRLLNIDNMQGPGGEITRRRQEKLEIAERLVEEQADEFGQWLRSRAAASTILELQQRLEELRVETAAGLAAELANSHNGSSKLAVDRYTRSLVRSILRQPIESLKALAASEDAEGQIETVRKLFGL